MYILTNCKCWPSSQSNDAKWGGGLSRKAYSNETAYDNVSISAHFNTFTIPKWKSHDNARFSLLCGKENFHLFSPC